jgi:DNA-binding NarL/FixJ family response regulator
MTQKIQARSALIEVLLVEDSPGDVRLTREALKDAKMHIIKESDALKSIPVVILTTSASPVDVEQSYKLHANCYITKPVDLQGFIKVVLSIDNFWLTIVKLPSAAGAP